MKIFRVLSLVSILMFFITSNKHPFAHIEIVEQIVTVYTGLTLQAQIQLRVGEQPLVSKGTTKPCPSR